MVAAIEVRLGRLNNQIPTGGTVNRCLEVTADAGANEGELQIKMYSQWIQMEHYRLHSVENWPDGAYKRATLAAIHSTLRSLFSIRLVESLPLQCSVCLERKRRVVVEVPLRPRMTEPPASLAA